MLKKKFKKITKIAFIITLILTTFSTSSNIIYAKQTNYTDNWYNPDSENSLYICKRLEDEYYIKTIVPSKDRTIITILDKNTQIIKSYIIYEQTYQDLEKEDNFSSYVPVFISNLDESNIDNFMQPRTSITHRYVSYFNDKHYAYSDKTHMLYYKGNSNHVSTGPKAKDSQIKLANRFEEQCTVSDNLLERIVSTVASQTPGIGTLSSIATQLEKIFQEHDYNVINLIDLCFSIICLHSGANIVVSSTAIAVDLPVLASARHNVKNYYNRACKEW